PVPIYRALGAHDLPVADPGPERAAPARPRALQRQAREVEPFARRREDRQLLVLEPEIRVDARFPPAPSGGPQAVDELAFPAVRRLGRRRVAAVGEPLALDRGLHRARD